jgi:hypothetical protein
MPPWTAILVLVVAVAAFMAGLQVNPTRVVTPTPSLSGPTPSPVSSAVLATPAPTGTPVAPPSLLPAGVYHLTQPEANEIAIASRFYAAYDAGQLATVMSLLSAAPHLSDCDYATHGEVTLDGRSAIEIYLRARFTEHDRWTVEFYQENPANSYVVVLPLQRSNDTLRRLGAPGGVKGSFPEDFYLAFNPDRAHLDTIAWNTMSGSVGALCSP